MGQVVASSRGFVVVVDRARSVATIQRDTRAGVVTDRRTAASVTERSTVVQVGAPGPAGPAGAPGGSFDTYVADGVLGGHRVVRATGDGLVGYADVTDPAHGDDILGLTLGAASDGDAVQVQRVGPVEFNGWSWTPGERVYLGTDGLPTQAVPDVPAAFLKVLGFAAAPTVLQLQPEPAIYL